jgi:hypothetical protein
MHMSVAESDRKTRVHIDGRPLELLNPISGVALYADAHVPDGEVLYREVVGDREDELVAKELPSVTLVQDEHFYGAHPHKVEHTIIVNARRKAVTGRKISFGQVVSLAFSDGPPSPQTIYTVAYSNGPSRNPEGKMVAGQTVRIRDGMVFDVTETTRS